MKFKYLLFIILLSSNAFAQKVRYKDVYELIIAKNFSAAFPQLKIVTKNDTTNASAFLHLGIIFYDRALRADVLKESESVKINSDSAIFYLKRAKRLATEKEVRRNDEYFLSYTYNKKDTAKPLTNKDTIFQRVTRDIPARISVIEKHKAESEKIFMNFNKSVDFYAKSVTTYRYLNNKYVSLKELCLLSNEAVELELKSVKTNYDSCIFYLEEYKKCIKNYPIKGYNQQYETLSIETFRLDGLSKSNFLDSKFKLWNYAKWATEVLNIIEREVKKMRNEVIAEDDKLEYYLDKIRAKIVNYDSIQNLKESKKLYSVISKYDYNSFLIRFLDYKFKKVKLFGEVLNPLNDVENSTGANFDVKTEFFLSALHKTFNCDSVLGKISLNNYQKDEPKIKYFVTPKFVDKEGLATYLDKEKFTLREVLNNYKKNYHNLMYNFSYKYSMSGMFVNVNNNQVPLYYSSESEGTIYKTLCIKEDKKGNILVCGYFSNNGVDNAFICKLDPNRQTIWSKNIPIKPENKAGNLGEYATVLEPTQDEGCVVVINIKTANSIRNYTLRLDKSGTEMSVRKYEAGGFVRKIIFDEINDYYIFAIKGNRVIDYSEIEEPMTIVCVDNLGNSKWIQKFNLLGNVGDFVKVFEGYFLLCNFASISTGTSVIASEAGTTFNLPNLFVMKFSIAGVVQKFEAIPSKTPIYANHIVRVNNNNINILGVNRELRLDWKNYKPTTEQEQEIYTVNSNLEKAQ